MSDGLSHIDLTPEDIEKLPAGLRRKIEADLDVDNAELRTEYLRTTPLLTVMDGSMVPSRKSVCPSRTMRSTRPASWPSPR